MTVSYKKLGKGSKGGDYYLNASMQDDYYSNDGGKEPHGTWFNPENRMPGAANNAATNPDDFRALMAGFDPITGEALCQGAGENHIAGYDFTFSAPKEVSVLWSQVSPEIRKEIEASQRAAVESAIAFMSEKAGITRRGKGGLIKEKVDLVAALFEHGSSRENDPQLHTHSVVLNLARRADGTYGTIDINQALKWQAATAGVYHTELAAQLSERLGVITAVKEDEFIFSIPAIPDRVKDQFSKRRKQIKEALKGSEFIDRNVIQNAVTETRDQKSELTREQLFERWEREGKAIGFSREVAEAYLNNKEHEPLTTEQITTIADLIPSYLTVTKSLFTEPQLYAAIGIKMQAKGDAADIQAAADYLFASDQLVQLGMDDNGNKVYSTSEMIALEKRMTAIARDSRNDAHVMATEAVDRAIINKVGMSAEQAEAVRHATQNERMVSIIEGAAGAGKSYTMDTVKEVYQSQGYTIHGLALSWSAADVLSDSAKIENARAIEGFVRQIVKGEMVLSPKSVIIIDECGLVGSRHMEVILSAAEKAGAKVILTGDSKQLLPVEAGGAAVALVQEIGSCRIDSIRRQKDEWQREAVLNFADGRASEGLQAYLENDCVVFNENQESTLAAMVEDWERYRQASPEKTTLMLANDNETVRELNNAIREKLKAEGKIAEQEIALRTSDLRKAFDLKFAVGDKIIFRKNDKELEIYGDPTKKEASGVYNRTQGQITAINLETENGVPEITIALGRGGSVTIQAGPEGYWDNKTHAVPIQHAYATTVYASQGMTVDQVFIKDSAFIERRLAYVGMSRHREGCKLYLDRENIHERIQTKRGSDEWTPQEQMTNAQALEEVVKAWSRASEKLTTVQYLNSKDQSKAEQTNGNVIQLSEVRIKFEQASQAETKRVKGELMHNLAKFKLASALRRYEKQGSEFEAQRERARNVDLPAFLMSKGIALKKDGSKQWIDPNTGDTFFRGKAGNWIATDKTRGQYFDAIGFLQQRQGINTRQAVIMLAGPDASSMTILRQPPAGRSCQVVIVQIQKPDQQATETGYAYARDRGISHATIVAANKQGFMTFNSDPKHYGPLFLGKDEQSRIRSAETRLVQAIELEDGDQLTKLCHSGTDKTYSPIMRGNDKKVHIVEGGFDALAIHDMATRRGEQPPTVIVTGGKDTMLWEANPQVAKLIQEADTVVVWRDREATPEKQAKTDAAVSKRMDKIKEMGGKVGMITPPEGCKDAADINFKQQEEIRLRQLEEQRRQQGYGM